MKNILQMLANVITKISKWLWMAGKWVAFFLMCLAFSDVFFRRLKLTFVGSKDLIEVTFLMLCFFSFSYAWIKGDHIHVDILIEKTLKIKKFAYLLGASLGVIFFGCLSWASFDLAVSSFRFRSVTPDLKFPHSVMQFAMLLGSILFTLQCIVSILFQLGIIKKPHLYDE